MVKKIKKHANEIADNGVSVAERVIPDHTLIETVKGFGSGVKGDVNDISKAGGVSSVAQATVPDKTVIRTIKGVGKGLSEDVGEVLGQKKKHKDTDGGKLF